MPDGGVRRSAIMPLALAGALLAWSAAHAADDPRKVCVASVVRLCPGAALTHNEKAAKVCLLKNLDKASPDCQAAVKAAQAAYASGAGGRH
ncbi:MAG TPA: hypothetical protein VG939_07435 [Caulobacteraceae bacterium]|nr:hypothetical protein [Caulobacteraceae bacterium]